MIVVEMRENHFVDNFYEDNIVLAAIPLYFGINILSSIVDVFI